VQGGRGDDGDQITADHDGRGAGLDDGHRDVHLDASVVIPTHDRRDSLLRTLAALDRQRTVTAAGRPFTFEVVVVADGCTDGTERAVRATPTTYPLRLVEQRNSGPAAARNAGVAVARGAVVVFIDDDVVPGPGCLAVHVGHHDDDPAIVVIGPMSTPPDHPMTPWVAWEQHQLEKWYPYFRSRPAAGYHHFYTGNASVGRRWLEQVGGFDATHTRAEDIELAHRLEGVGCRFEVDLDATAQHYAERSLDSWRRIAFDYGRNEVVFSAAGVPDRLDRFREKHRATSPLQRFVVERLAPRRAGTLVATAAESVAVLADRVGLRRVSNAALSGAYALRYHAGVVDALGSRRAYLAALHRPPGGPMVAGVVVEQALGHITHGANLERLLAEIDELDVVYLPIDQSLDGVGRYVPGWSNWTLRAGLRARAAVRRHWRRSPDRRFEALFVHTQVPAMLLGRWMRRIPTVVSLDATPRQYDELGDTYDHARAPDAVERLKHRLHRATLDRAAHLVTWSEWTKRGLVADYGVEPWKVTVIAPGVDVEAWRPVEAPERHGSDRDGLDRQAVPDEPVRILFVGGDLRRKGGDLLVRAVDVLTAVEGLPDVELHLVTRSDVEERPGVVVHRGLGPNSPELVDLYRTADVFCLPTLGDCLPMVLAEAGAAGLPIVSTDVGAVSEVVRDGETGLLVPPGDLDALVDALARLLADRRLRTSLGRGARRLVVEQHDARRNAREVARLVSETAGRVPDRQPAR
jgi:glycosyltransferase involved in cell wall biosynthesis/GT2 family glycosyltransferase